MTEERPEKTYPIRSLHEFLSELDREWDRFRTGSLISMVASGVLLVFFVLRFLRFAIRRLDVVDIIFFMLVTVFLVYSIYAMLVQHRFFSRWERRMGLLLHLEEELMSERLEENASK